MNRYFYFNEPCIVNFVVKHPLGHLNIGVVNVVLKKQAVPPDVKQVYA